MAVGMNMEWDGVTRELLQLHSAHSPYKMNELALHGFPKVALKTLARMITRRTEPHVKLHCIGRRHGGGTRHRALSSWTRH